MSGLLKDRYSVDFFEHFSENLGQVIPAFNKRYFFQYIFDEKWDSRELKERMKHIAFVLNKFLPADFLATADIIKRIIDNLRQENLKEASFEYMFLPDYIENYGINYYDTSIGLMEFVTPFASCEFAVRRFIVNYGDKMLQQMQQWTLHENYHVRRLASEGSRPRLPWAISLPDLKKNPAPILPILESLKDDPSDYVRRSVANNLNDISKDNPDIVISIAKKWKGQKKETDKIIKHASRTLLKQGNPYILKHFGLFGTSKIVVDKFSIHTPKVRIGDNLEFSFSIQNIDSKNLDVRIEYGLYYVRKRGHHTKKVFKIAERQIKPAEKVDITRKQSFKIITTRKFYSGHHKVSLIVNGQEKWFKKFELTN